MQSKQTNAAEALNTGRGKERGEQLEETRIYYTITVRNIQLYNMKDTNAVEAVNAGRWKEKGRQAGSNTYILYNYYTNIQTLQYIKQKILVNYYAE